MHEAPGCTVVDLSGSVQFLIAHTDQVTELKDAHQFSITASGEIFLHIACIKMSVEQGISIFKDPDRW
ncbi:hypothetical protein PHMEG_00023489 [Phytophthora megakarya]|uniref:Uncharacterized protein n=1 Tax=Phytophthora megakarya TaxID=4795 RepID=A0A225VGQ3_9STRA|nr:hypothetical protein PHMEG_00023489 [Phytophthora megakarya]